MPLPASPPRRARRRPQHQKQQHRAQPVHQQARQMMPPRLHPEQLDIQHVRERRQRMPVSTHVRPRERTLQPHPTQPLLHSPIPHHIQLVVIFHEPIAQRRRERPRHQQPQCHTPRHRRARSPIICRRDQHTPARSGLRRAAVFARDTSRTFIANKISPRHCAARTLDKPTPPGNRAKRSSAGPTRPGLASDGQIAIASLPSFASLTIDRADRASSSARIWPASRLAVTGRGHARRVLAGGRA